eukprot:s1645_g5.t1
MGEPSLRCLTCHGKFGPLHSELRCHTCVLLYRIQGALLSEHFDAKDLDLVIPELKQTYYRVLELADSRRRSKLGGSESPRPEDKQEDLSTTPKSKPPEKPQEVRKETTGIEKQKEEQKVKSNKKEKKQKPKDREPKEEARGSRPSEPRHRSRSRRRRPESDSRERRRSPIQRERKSRSEEEGRPRSEQRGDRKPTLRPKSPPGPPPSRREEWPRWEGPIPAYQRPTWDPKPVRHEEAQNKGVKKRKQQALFNESLAGVAGRRPGAGALAKAKAKAGAQDLLGDKDISVAYAASEEVEEKRFPFQEWCTGQRLAFHGAGRLEEQVPIAGTVRGVRTENWQAIMKVRRLRKASERRMRERKGFRIPHSSRGEEGFQQLRRGGSQEEEREEVDEEKERRQGHVEKLTHKGAGLTLWGDSASTSFQGTQQHQEKGKTSGEEKEQERGDFKHYISEELPWEHQLRKGAWPYVWPSDQSERRQRKGRGEARQAREGKRRQGKTDEVIEEQHRESLDSEVRVKKLADEKIEEQRRESLDSEVNVKTLAGDSARL